MSDFGKADRDKNRTLDRAEATALPDVAAHFDAIDSDKDATVSNNEVKIYEKFTRKDKDANDPPDRRLAQDRRRIGLSRRDAPAFKLIPRQYQLPPAQISLRNYSGCCALRRCRTFNRK